MEKAGLDALIVYSPQFKVEYIHYTANFRVLGKDAAMVLPLEGEPTLYLSQPWDAPRAAAESWIKNIVINPIDMMHSVGLEAAKHGKNIGIAGSEIMSSTLFAQLDSKLADKNDSNQFALLDKCALTKTEWELEIIRKCASLADDGYTALLNTMHVGMYEYEAVAEMEYAMRLGGADDDFQMIGMSARLPSMNLATENRLKMGDLVEAEITPMIGSITYATQLCKTVKMGPASDVEKEKFGLLVEGLEYALSKMKAGVRACDPCLWQNEIIGSAGYEEYCHPPYMRSRGHNFGLGSIDLNENNDMLLEPGMVMVVHPNQFIPECGYLVLGETVIVTETGIERLSGIPSKLVEILPN
jgi:Xaa-Pro aminopeptidase